MRLVIINITVMPQHYLTKMSTNTHEHIFDNHNNIHYCTK